MQPRLGKGGSQRLLKGMGGGRSMQFRKLERWGGGVFGQQNNSKGSTTAVKGLVYQASQMSESARIMTSCATPCWELYHLRHHTKKERNLIGVFRWFKVRIFCLIRHVLTSWDLQRTSEIDTLEANLGHWSTFDPRELLGNQGKIRFLFFHLLCT